MEIRDPQIEIKEEPLEGRRSQESIPEMDRAIYRRSPDPYPVRNQVMINGGLSNHALNLSHPLPLPPGMPERPPAPPSGISERLPVDRRASFSSSGQDEPSTDSEAVSYLFVYSLKKSF